MEVWYNPLLLSKILKSYIFDFNRLWRLNQKELEKFKDKKFRKIVKYAYTVPMYHDLYKKAGVNPKDIRGIKDIKKLPFVSKDELEKYYPDGLISSKTKKENLIQVSTSGTTGRHLSIFVDPYDTIVGLLGYIRALKEFDINWRKDKLTIIGDFAPHTAESGYINRGALGKSDGGFLTKNIQWLSTNDKPEEIIGKIDKFNPDFLGAYVGMLGHLALLKEKGLGKNINPKVIGATGSVFDETLKKYVQNIFDAKIFEAYGTTEAGPIAFTCQNGEYHVLSDYVHLEVIEDGKYVSSGKPGHAVITKLYGLGTPVIRYTAINDIVSTLSKKGSCGMSGDLIKKVYGRDILALYLKNGKVLLPAAITQIFSKILYELKTNKVIDLQVVQHDFDNFEVKVVFDEKLRDVGPSVEEVFKLISKGFKEKLQSNVKITIKETKKINKKEPRIVSKINIKNFEKTGYVI